MPRAVTDLFRIFKSKPQPAASLPLRELRKKLSSALKRGLSLNTAVFNLDFLRQHKVQTKDIELALGQLEIASQKAKKDLPTHLTEKMNITTSRNYNRARYSGKGKTDLTIRSWFELDDLVFLNNDCQAFHIWLGVYQLRKTQYELLKLVEHKYKNLIVEKGVRTKEGKAAAAILIDIRKERDTIASKLLVFAKKAVEFQTKSNNKNDLGFLLLPEEVEMLELETILNLMPRQFNGITARIREKIAKINDFISLIRSQPWLPSKATATISTALMCLTLAQGIAHEPESGPPPEDDLPAQVDTPPESREQKNQAVRARATSRIKSLIGQRTDASNASRIGLAKMIDQAARRGKANPAAIRELLPPSARQKVEEAPTAATSVEAFTKAIVENSMPIREQYQIFNSKIAPLLNDLATPEAVKAKVRELGARFHDIEVPPQGTGENEGIRNNNNREVASTETRANDQKIVGANNADFQFGHVRSRKNYDEGHFMESVLDQMENGNLTQSTSAPVDPSTVTLDQDRHVELSQNFNAAEGIQLLETTDGAVDPSSIRFEDFEGHEISGLTYSTRVDRFGFVHLENFSDQSLRGQVIYKIRPMLEAGRVNTAEIEAHYRQTTPQEPLDIPEEMQPFFESWQRHLSPALIAGNLASYLQNYAVYSTSAEVDQLYANTEHSRTNIFLRERVGSCRHFNEAFVVIMREYFGLPARLANGYLYDLNNRNSHRWAEVFYDGSWHSFDSTGQAPNTLSSTSDQNELATRPATPANLFALQAKLEERVNESYRFGVQNLANEEPAERQAYWRLANELGGEYLSTAIATNLRHIETRYEFDNANEAIANAFNAIESTDPATDATHFHFNEVYFPDSSPVAQAIINQAVTNKIRSESTTSVKRASYMIAFHLFDQVDEYFAAGQLTLPDYLTVRITQSYITDRSLNDLVQSPAIRRFVAQNDNAGSLLSLRFVDSGLSHVAYYSSFRPDHHMAFLYECLVREGQIDRFFARNINTLHSSAVIATFPGFNSGLGYSSHSRHTLFSFLAYIAYREQNQTYRQQLGQKINAQLTFRNADGTENPFNALNLNWLQTAFNSPWHMYVSTNDGQGTTSLPQLFSGHYPTNRLKLAQARELFSPYFDQFETDLRVSVAGVIQSYRAVGFDPGYIESNYNQSMSLFSSLLAYAKMDSNPERFLSVARQIAPYVLTAVESGRGDLLDIDLNSLDQLLYLDEDGTGLRILTSLLSSTTFADSYQRNAFLIAYVEAQEERPADFHSSREAAFAILDFNPVYHSLWFDYMLEVGDSHETITELYENRNWITQEEGTGPALIHTLLLNNLVAEARGLDLSATTGRLVEQTFAQGNFEGETFLPDLLYAELSAEAVLPNNTHDLYLQTLNQSLQGVELEEEDVSQIRTVIANNPSPESLRLLAHVARSENRNLELASFAFFIPDFLSSHESLPKNEKLLIGLFLLSQADPVSTGPEANQNFLSVRRQIFDIIETANPNLNEADRQALTSNLHQARQFFLGRQRMLQSMALHTQHFSVDLEVIDDTLERVEEISERYGLESTVDS